MRYKYSKYDNPETLTVQLELKRVNVSKGEDIAETIFQSLMTRNLAEEI